MACHGAGVPPAACGRQGALGAGRGTSPPVGDRLLWNGFWTDITEDHEAADLLRQAKDQAESATEAKSMFWPT